MTNQSDNHKRCNSQLQIAERLKRCANQNELASIHSQICLLPSPVPDRTLRKWGRLGALAEKRAGAAL
jgi:hypothetical protein